MSGEAVRLVDPARAGQERDRARDAGEANPCSKLERGEDRCPRWRDDEQSELSINVQVLALALANARAWTIR